ncbi:hypothetical protein [Bacillus sp. 7884-1]|uniref:hypothetical protein n=1 Tax=Bacillus sp. 7884-1 TaxID=2021693 RepID=UPI0015CDC4C9|nr:hypothetical protein [Bacillus sp. 7884-1]
MKTKNSLVIELNNLIQSLKNNQEKLHQLEMAGFHPLSDNRQLTAITAPPSVITRIED